MKLSVKGFLVGIAATALIVGLSAVEANASGLRSPQVALNGVHLQNFFNAKGQALNVYADQWDIQCWSTTASGNSSFTIMFEMGDNVNANNVGIYNCTDVNPAFFQLFPGLASPGWFAIASFDVGFPGRLVVSLFDNFAAFQGQSIYLGVNSGNFGFYLQGPGGTFYSQDARNGGNAQMLTYPGTGTSAGQWWLAFEDLPFLLGDPLTDFDDLVLFMESVNPPVPIRQTTWGDIKALYAQ